MDHELKQRLIGAVVVTALAAIFIPMLFDDPVDTSGKTVTELTIPQAPSDDALTAQNIPENKAQVLNRQDIELNAAEINDDSQASSTDQLQSTTIPDGEQTQQPDMADAANGLNVPEHEPSDGLGANQAGQNKEPTLDTGDQDASPPVAVQEGKITPNEPTNKPNQGFDTPTQKSAKKPKAIEKQKAKSAGSPEKTKAVAKAQDEPVKKSSSKLVRYSIQAGSFSKKENAQALVEKLRKQGMPATLVAKGDFFRVKVGPSLDKAKAKEMKAKLDKQNIKGLLVTE
jgi:DedD protein